LIVVAVGAQESMDCTLHVNDGTHYDLSELKLRAAIKVTGGDLSWTTEVEESYEYMFGVCRELQKSKGEVPEVCVEQDEDDMPVYQYQDGKDCHIAGKILSSTKIELLDASKPAAGVKVNYTMGSQCSTYTRDYKKCGATGEPECPHRQTAIHFVCSDEDVEPWGAIEVNTFGQPSHCEYQIAINTIHGCPQQCGTVYDESSKKRKLCGGHGMCSYDKTNAKSKCFCDDGWTGNDCNSQSSGAVAGAGMSGTAVGLLVVLLLISIALVGLVVFMAKQVRAYRNDATNYMQIRGQEMSDEVGTI